MTPPPQRDAGTVTGGRRARRRRGLAAWLALVAGLSAGRPAAAAPVEAPPPAGPPRIAAAGPAGAIVVPRTDSAVRIDGLLDEPAWSGAARVALEYEVQPGENVAPPVATECLITYDDRRLLVAFRAHDPDPSAIRAHLSDRDTIQRDDMVGIFLDTFNDERRGFMFFVNPLGVQSDAVRNDVGGGQTDPEDPTWDAIWDAAGRITGEGYQVEMAIPFSSLRFPGVDGSQTWGFFAFRAYPRNFRHQIFNRPIERGRSCFLCQGAKLTGLVGLTPGGRLELIPTVTARHQDRREEVAGGALERGDIEPEIGLTGRFAATPNLILGAIANPDFSQVEADVPQLSENTRFALFYPEKRPFFLESADFFETPLQAVYTRTVADPNWGAKVSGKLGGGALGVGHAEDAITGLVLPSNQGSEVVTLEQENRPSVARYRHDIGAGSTVGALYTGREGEGYHNRVWGADGVLRLTGEDTILFQYLRSDTRYPRSVVDEYAQPDGSFKDHGARLRFGHESRDWFFAADYRDLGPGFRADAGFIPRVDIRRLAGAAARNWWGAEGAALTRVTAEISGERIEDHDGLLTDQRVGLELDLRGPRQLFLSTEVDAVKEHFEGVTYDQARGGFFFNIRPTGDFTTSFAADFGGAVDYDNARAARRLRLAPGITWDFGRHLHLQADHVHERLAVAEGTIYAANLSYLRVVYQFTLRAFARVVMQRSAVSRDVALYDDPATEPDAREYLAQLLFSYKVNPQTLAYVGWSETRSDAWGPEPQVDDRAIFFKVGYAWLR